MGMDGGENGKDRGEGENCIGGIWVTMLEWIGKVVTKKIEANGRGHGGGKMKGQVHDGESLEWIVVACGQINFCV